MTERANQTCAGLALSIGLRPGSRAPAEWPQPGELPLRGARGNQCSLTSSPMRCSFITFVLRATPGGTPATKTIWSP